MAVASSRSSSVSNRASNSPTLPCAAASKAAPFFLASITAPPSRRRSWRQSRSAPPGRRTRTAPWPRRAPAAESILHGRDGGPRAGPSCGTALDAGEGGAEAVDFPRLRQRYGCRLDQLGHGGAGFVVDRQMV